MLDASTEIDTFTDSLQENERGKVDIMNQEKQEMILRIANEDDLDEIFTIIQTVGKEIESKNHELFAYSKNKDTYLHMLRTGICAVAVEGDKIIASLLTRPEDNKEGILNLTGIPRMTISETIEFATCEVLEKYRGNKLEQKLIDFVLAELNKSEQYKYAICTVSPDNKASLKSVKNSGFAIYTKAKLYGGKTRYVLMKQI